jgi:hypothetical protein
VNVLLCRCGTGRSDLYGWDKKFETLYLSSQFEIIFNKDGVADNLLYQPYSTISKSAKNK